MSPDETCIMAGKNVDQTCIMVGKNVAKIVGSAGRRKHETTSDDSRVSVTMFRTGNADGTPGPTVYLVKSKGKNVPQAVAAEDDNEEEDNINDNNDEDEVEEVVSSTK